MSSTELAIHTLNLMLLPRAIGSFLNLGDKHQRWLTYYLIWYQMMSKREDAELYFYIIFDMVLVANMDAIYNQHLTSLVGGKIIPSSVYYSSFASNSRLDAYLADHRSVNATIEVQGKDKYPNEKQTSIIINQEGLTTTATTQTTKKATWVYLFVTAALVLNSYLKMSTAFWSLLCMPSNHGRFLSEESVDYLHKTHFYSCFLHSSYIYTPLHPSLPLPSTILIRATALLVALAWSTLPTQTIIRAWIRMWNSNNNAGYLRKIHYVIYMLPVKILACLFIEFGTTLEWQNEDETWSSNRGAYYLAWSFLFRQGVDLVFGLALIWNLYSVHTRPGTVIAATAFVPVDKRKSDV
ncbi:hypothetical protein BGX29_008941 [Mortierella sp. GBA35]|nr:hypothetical protein BGX29_008941 [Mortierella sp. GBA35]